MKFEPGSLLKSLKMINLIEAFVADNDWNYNDITLVFKDEILIFQTKHLGETQ